MKKSTKGAVAASAAALLLLGSMGTQAGWTDQAVGGGGTVTAGHLNLDVLCQGWELGGVAVPDVADVRLVPGDTLTQICTFTVDLLGTSLEATLDADNALLTGDLAEKVTFDAAFTDADGAEVSGVVAISDGDEFTATISVVLPSGLLASEAEDMSAVLSDFTVTATQVA